MKYEKVDLYEYFGVERNGANGGYLTAYCRNRIAAVEGERRPAMLVIPGGGYAFVSEREAEPVALKYLGVGFCSFVLQYSVQVPFPAALLEGCMAVVYIRENAAKYCVDSEHIAAIGFSAGGHLALTLANLYDCAQVQQVLREKTELAKISALVLSYPVVSLTDFTHAGSRNIVTGGDGALAELLSMERRITSNAPPAFIWHTVSDGSVPVENSLMLARAYKAANVDFALHLFEKGSHGLSLCDVETCGAIGAEPYLTHVGKWFDLSVDWLYDHGFGNNRE